MLKDYIATNEFNKIAGVSRSLMYQIIGVQKLTLGGNGFIKKTTIPSKYMKYANQCKDLTNYIPVTTFCELIGRSRSYIGVLKSQGKKFELLEIGKKNQLLYINDEFLKLINDGKVFMVIRKPGDELDFDGVIEVQGIKIGWY